MWCLLDSKNSISGRFKGGKGGGGCKCTPLWRLVMYFCVHICTSLSNDYTAVACSNNNQAQLHTHVLVPYWSPDVCLDLELLRDIQFGLPPILNNSLASYDNNYVCHKCIYVTRNGHDNPKIFGRAATWTPLSKCLNPPLSISATDKIWDTFHKVKLTLKLDNHSIVLITRVYTEIHTK